MFAVKLSLAIKLMWMKVFPLVDNKNALLKICESSPNIRKGSYKSLNKVTIQAI